MSRKALLIFVLLALVSIVGVVVTQVYWFKQAYNNNEEEFNKNVRIALKEVVKGIIKYNNTSTMPNEPVQQVTSNYFMVMVNDRIDAQVLQHYLQVELNKFNVKQGYEFNIYDCANRKMLYAEYADGSTALPVNIDNKLLTGDNYYFTVYFPHKSSGIVKNMTLWIYSSGIVMVVVVFFMYSLFVILRQKRLSEIQRDFINNMAHEIRTPLSTISISAETIKNPDMVHNPSRLLNYATIIMHESNKLRIQLERVLSIAETENNIKITLEDINVHNLILETAHHGINKVSAKKITFSTDFQAKRHVICGDKLHLTNVFANLIDNAVKYSNDELKLNISTCERQQGLLEIAITDNGIGISKEHQKKIFDKFYRVPTGNVHNTKGFGIGLSYVSLITKLHKGTIKVQSDGSNGTTFTLNFPLI